MKKRILIIHSNMAIGGAESSLLGILQTVDYTRCDVDLMLLDKSGDLLSLIPQNVNIINTPNCYKCLAAPIKDVVFKYHNLPIALARLVAKQRGKGKADPTYRTKQFAHKYSLPLLKKIPGKYNLAISFIDPHYVLGKTDAKIKLAWLHTDFSNIEIDRKTDHDMWNLADYIVNISDACQQKFLEKHPDLRHKSIVIENILSGAFLNAQAHCLDVKQEMSSEGIKILSIGRFSYPKNFDNVPEICKLIRGMGHDITWYIIGYGGEESLIREKIVEHGMQDYVVILGKKDNPYPYINACDVYVQPSRYEGKCVAVREAQILHKPVIITNYSTSSSQLEDRVDGIVVPMDNHACTEGIAKTLSDNDLLDSLVENCKTRDYTNSQEIQKIYNLLNL